MIPGKQPDPAAARFAMLQMVRLMGALLVLVGVLALSGKVSVLADLPAVAAYVLIAAGLIDYFVLPPLLAKRWRSK